MSYFNIFIWILIGYVVLVLLAELLVWRLQPSMDGGVTIVVTLDDGTRIARNLYGFEHDSRRRHGEEHDRLSSQYNMGAVLRFICGFAPSKFLRLDPVS